jgi:hypothetical protein
MIPASTHRRSPWFASPRFPQPSANNSQPNMERVTRFERATSTLARLRSTPELHPLVLWAEYVGKALKSKGILDGGAGIRA